MRKRIKYTLIALVALTFVLITESNLHSGSDSFMSMIRNEMKMYSPKTLKLEGRIMKSIASATRKQIIEPPLVTAIMSNESAYKQYAYSPKKARGLMQLVRLGAKQAEWETGRSYFDPVKNTNGKIIGWELNKWKVYNIENNIHGGVGLLEWLAKKYPMYYEDGTMDEDNLKVVIELYNVGWGNYHYYNVRNAKYVRDVMRIYKRHRKAFYDSYGTDEGFNKYCKNQYKKKRISKRRSRK